MRIQLAAACAALGLAQASCADAGHGGGPGATGPGSAPPVTPPRIAVPIGPGEARPLPAPTPRRVRPFRLPPEFPKQFEYVQRIEVRDDGFFPPYNMSPLGTTFVWENVSSVSHTITHSEGDFTVTLTPGATHSEYCVVPGEYPYHCTIHGHKGNNVANAEMAEKLWNAKLPAKK